MANTSRPLITGTVGFGGPSDAELVALLRARAGIQRATSTPRPATAPAARPVSPPIATKPTPAPTVAPATPRLAAPAVRATSAPAPVPLDPRRVAVAAAELELRRRGYDPAVVRRMYAAGGLDADRMLAEHLPNVLDNLRPTR
jgi:hypothetical protein